MKDSRYEEALERAKRGLPIDEVFPELKESEDEKIRKFLVKHVSEWIGCIEHDLKFSSKDVESEEELAMFKAGLAYLEKQKEQSTLNFYVPEGADMNSTKNKIAVILGQYKSQGFIEEQEYYSMLKYIGEKEQKPSEWSEEDEKNWNEYIERLKLEYSKTPNVVLWDDINWLEILHKKLKSLRPQPKHCGNTYYDIIHSILDMLKGVDFTQITPDHRVSLLNDIRVKCKNADECAAILDESHWKPSEEQMEALDNARFCKSYDRSELDSLYEQLNKLFCL